MISYYINIVIVKTEQDETKLRQTKPHQKYEIKNAGKADPVGIGAVERCDILHVNRNRK
jgi:hypothetical protein